MQVQISTSARGTWIWAPDKPTSIAIRQILDAGKHYWSPAQRGRAEVPYVTDVEIGVVALAACEDLACAGYVFDWHPDQHPDSRDSWPADLPGMPPAPIP